MGLNGQLYWYALPAFVALALIELALLRRRGIEGYRLGDSLASLGVAIGRKVATALAAGLTSGLVLFVWRHRLWTAPLQGAWSFVALFLLSEFLYYWHHRFSHEVRFLWASHAVHHSTPDINILAADRLPWTGMIMASAIIICPEVLLGFKPAAAVTMLAANLLYQSWLHTKLIGRLGPFEWLFNTPSYHRVHHATNPAYLDRNYGGVTVIFDRLFGTLVVERADEPCRYGLVKPVTSRNPIVIAFHEWMRLAGDLRRAGSWRVALGHIIGPPGWTPDARAMPPVRLNGVGV